MELPWVAAASGVGQSPARGTPRWSQGTLLAYLTEEECHVIDMQAALEKTGEAWLVKKFKAVEAKGKGLKRHRTDLPLAQHVLQTKPVPCSMSWSPPGGMVGFLLALADTSGSVKIYAPQLPDSAPVLDLTEEFVAKTATSATPVVEVCFAPTHSASGASGGPVVCASRGSTVMLWTLEGKEGKEGKHGVRSHLLKSIVLEDGPSGPDIITGLDLSMSWARENKETKGRKNEKNEVNTLLILGTNQGHLLTKKLTFKSQTGQTGPSSPSISSFCELIKVDAPISDVVISSDPSMNGTDFLIVVAQGVQVSAVLLEVSGSGNVSCRKFSASPPCHGVPIVSACCDTAGVFANVAQLGSSFVERANIFTMDSMGHGVIWRLPEGGQTLEPRQLCSLAAKTMQNYFTAIEQAAICMETRMVRTAAREREYAQDNKLLCGFTLSPSHCLLVTQSTVPSARTTQIRPVTFLLATALGTPSHAFTAMLRHVVQALRAARLRHTTRNASGFQLSLWDVHEAWRSMMFGAGRSPVTMSREPKEALELPCAILEAALSWLWDLQEGFGKAYDSICHQTFSSADKTASPASCKTTLLLRHTAAQSISLSLGSSKSLTERWATATARQQHFLNFLRDELGEVDPLVVCQLRNAWLELGRNATRDKTQRKYGSYTEPLVKKPRALQAATSAYWQQRLEKFGLKNSIAKDQAVAAFLHNVEDIGRAGQTAETPNFAPGSECQLCGKQLRVDSTLMRASCGSHHFPLCQRDLRPLLAEPHLLCSFCGRCTLLDDGDPAICAWCATVS